MRYRQIEADERIEMMRSRNVKRLAIGMALLWWTIAVYLAGQSTQMELAIRSTDNAEYAARLLWVCTESQVRTLAVVLAEDAELHQTLRALPPIVWKVD